MDQKSLDAWFDYKIKEAITHGSTLDTEVLRTYAQRYVEMRGSHMSEKHYNIQISVQEVTEAAPEKLERGVRVQSATPKTHRDLLSVTLQADNLIDATARGIDVLYLLKPKEEK